MIIGQKISSSMFFWHPDKATFTQEISTLKGRNMFGLLYDDACDQGFVMVSDRTGEELPFYLDEKVEYGDEITWTYRPITNDPRLQQLKVVVFND